MHMSTSLERRRVAASQAARSLVEGTRALVTGRGDAHEAQKLVTHVDGGRTARVETEVDAPIDDVFAVLADPDTYEDWVVGAKEIRDWEPSWPKSGATFHHTQGMSFLQLKDTTSVVECRAPERLVLEVRARPVLVARTEFRLTRMGESRTRVVMYETPTGGFLRALDNPALTAAARARNTEALRRFRRIAESASH